MAIPREVIETIRDRINIADVIGERVQLKRSGRSLTGLCPFHSEKSPSFSVREEQGTFRCFGCGKRGTVFDFLMETRGLSFFEAAKYLAAKAGVQIPEDLPRSDEERALQAESRALRAVLRDVAEIFRKTLLDRDAGREAASYLRSRGMSEETLARFSVGFAPDRRNFLHTHLEKGSTEERGRVVKHLQQSGLLVSRDGESYDAFRDRVIFPITRSDGAPVAFGGRILHPHPNRPKYINSPESSVYKKGKTLYGLSQAMESARKARSAYLVEGYMDVLSMHQAELVNTVATCGTAVTPDHALLLKRFVDRVTVVFDGDSAGRKAAASCFEVFLNSGIDVSAVLLPEGDDPGSLLESGRIPELQRLVTSETVPLVDLYLERLLGDDPSAALRGKAAEQFARVLLRVTNPVEREHLMKRGAERFGVSFEALRELILQQRSQRRSDLSTPSRSSASPQSFPPKPPAPVSPPRPERREGRSQPASEREPAPPKLERLTPFARQIAVAVLCEPQLVGMLREMPSLSGEQEAARVLPAGVKKLLSLIERGAFRGAVARPATEEDKLANSLLQGLLIECELERHRLLEEAVRQLTVGGTNPKKVIEGAAEAANRQSLLGEVKEIRSQEATSEGQAQLGDLAQEKLMKRRELEKMRQKAR